MSFTIQEIRQARERIRPYVLETPLIRLENLDRFLGCRVYIKADCMQLTGAFKLRGAMNRMLTLTKEELGRGVVAASSGNHGRGLAYAAKMLGAKATIVMPKNAPALKINNIKALDAEVVLCEPSERMAVAESICRERGSVLVPPFNDERIMAGQGTAGVELIEQGPAFASVIVPVSGGGLISGISTAVKALSPSTAVYGAEPAPLPRYSKSLAMGEAVTVPQQSTVADALIGQTPGSKCFPVIQRNVDGVYPVSDAYTLKAMKLLLTEGKIMAEPSACIGIGAVLEGSVRVKAEENVCFFVSGGNVSIEQLQVLEEVSL